MIKIKRMVTLVVSLILVGSISLNVFALPDVSHNYYEEDKLFEKTWYKGTCINKKDTCEKHILRYESVEDFIKYLEKNLRSINLQNIETSCKRYAGITAITTLGTAAILVLLKVILSCKNIHVLLAMIASGTVIYILKPVKGFFSFIFDSIPQLVEFIKRKLSKEKLTTDERGLITKFFDLLLGPKKTTDESLATEKQIYEGILESLKNRISRREYLDNDVLIVSWDSDPENPSFSINFDILGYTINYDKDKREYFNN